MSVNKDAAVDRAPNVAEEADFYNDLVVERYSLNLETSTASMGDDDPENISWTVFDTEIAGGLGRHQAAELVAYEVMMHSMTTKEQSLDATTGLVEGNSAWFLLEQGEEPFDAEDIEVPIETAGSMEAQIAEFRKNPHPHGSYLLTDDFHYAEQSAYNTGDGLAAGGHPLNVNSKFTNLRKEFGRGPLAFPDWVLGNNLFIRSHEIDNEEVLFRTHLQTYWDVFELEEQPTYRDIFGTGGD